MAVGTINSISVGTLSTVFDVLGKSTPRAWVDGPAYPYRDGYGQKYLAIPHSENYRVKVDSWSNSSSWSLQGSVFNSARDVVEGHYNNRSWIYGMWADGNNIYANTHHEWYVYTMVVDGLPGNNALNTGDPETFNTKWVNAIGHAVSTTGGASWSVSPNNNSSRIIVIPEPWNVQQAIPMYGFFHPSNIVKEGNYYYFLAEQRSIIAPTNRTTMTGVSMFRTTNPAIPTGWQYWSGSTWVTINHNSWQGNTSSQIPHRFFELPDNAYTNDDGNASSHMGQSLRYHVPTQQWLMFGFSGQVAAPFFGYSRTDTLANPSWTTPVAISGVGDDFISAAGRYISVFDEGASDQNFQNIGNNLTVITTRDYQYLKKGSVSLSVTLPPPPVDRILRIRNSQNTGWLVCPENSVRVRANNNLGWIPLNHSNSKVRNSANNGWIDLFNT